MSEFKGTKGQWICYRKTDQHKIEEVLTKDNVSVCLIPYNLEESEYNAKLISCAPEMLEMLQNVLDNVSEEYWKIKEDIEELIKKATEL